MRSVYGWVQTRSTGINVGCAICVDGGALDRDVCGQGRGVVCIVGGAAACCIWFAVCMALITGLPTATVSPLCLNFCSVLWLLVSLAPSMVTALATMVMSPLRAATSEPVCLYCPPAAMVVLPAMLPTVEAAAVVLVPCWFRLCCCLPTVKPAPPLENTPEVLLSLKLCSLVVLVVASIVRLFCAESVVLWSLMAWLLPAAERLASTRPITASPNRA